MVQKAMTYRLPIYLLVYFSPYFYSNWGNGGIAVGEIRVYIEFIVDSDPTLQILG